MRNVILTAIAFLMASLLGACSSSGTLGCTASGTVSSGTASAANQTVTLATTVSITGGSTPYSVTLPGEGAVSTSSTSYSGTATGTTSAANTLATEVTVSDSSTSVQCAISIASTSLTSTTGVYAVSEILNTGYSATLLATDPNYPDATFSFQPVTTGTGLSISSVGTSENEATVTTTIPGTFELSVAEFNAGAYVQAITATVTLLGYGVTGSTGTTTGLLTCTLNLAGGTYYIDQEIQFPITTSDGELAVIQNATVSGPEGLTPPSFPIYTNQVPFNLTFSGVGIPAGAQEETETVEIWATDTSGNQCINNPLTATLYINE